MTTQSQNTNGNNSSANSNEEVKFFDITTHASGYPRRAREIPVQKGSAYNRVDMGARFGRAGDLGYVNYDLKVSGQSVTEDYEKVTAAINSDDHEVVWCVTIGDAYPKPFTYKNGAKKGETGVTMMGRLLKIIWCSVDGELVVDNRRKLESVSDNDGQQDLPAEQPADQAESAQASPEPVAAADRTVD